MVALQASAYDIASSGALRMGTNARTVAIGGLVVGQCQLCGSIDGVTKSMNNARVNQGRPAEFVMTENELGTTLNTGTKMYEPPTAGSRGSFGFSHSLLPTTDIEVRMDRPFETTRMSGFSMRESTGSDAGSLCFRRYRVTSTANFAPPIVGAEGNTIYAQRSCVIAGPQECAM